jgi:hypothetical protein
MKRYLPLALGVLVALVAIQQFFSKAKDREAVALREASAARLQRDYLERVGLLRAQPDEQAYREDVASFLRWYFGEVETHRKKFGGSKDHDEYLTELEARAAKQKDDNLALKKAYYGQVKATFDLMREGKYRPAFTATDKGMRLDLLPASVQAVAGAPRVVVPVVLWGASREERLDERNLRRVTASASFDAQVRLLDARGKVVAEMPISGGPDLRVEHPERYVREFPPQVVLGRYELPLLPAQVVKLEATIRVTSKPPYGRASEASYAWKLDVPAEWKLRAGEAWDGAETVERADEDLSASDAAQ